MGDSLDIGTVTDAETAVEEAVVESVPLLEEEDGVPEWVKEAQMLLGQESGNSQIRSGVAGPKHHDHTFYQQQHERGSFNGLIRQLTAIDIAITNLNHQIETLNTKIGESKTSLASKIGLKNTLVKIGDTQKELEINRVQIDDAAVKATETNLALVEAQKANNEALTASNAAIDALKGNVPSKDSFLASVEKPLDLATAIEPPKPKIINVSMQMEGSNFSGTYTVSQGDDGKYYAFPNGHDSMLGSTPAPDPQEFKPVSFNTTLTLGDKPTEGAFSSGMSYDLGSRTTGSGLKLDSGLKPLFTSVGAVEITDPALIAKIKEQQAGGAVFANSSDEALTEAKKLDREQIASIGLFEKTKKAGDAVFDTAGKVQTCTINHKNALEELKNLQDKRVELQEQLEKLNKEAPGNLDEKTRTENIQKLEGEIKGLTEKIKDMERERDEKTLQRDQLKEERGKCVSEINGLKSPGLSYDSKQADLEEKVMRQVDNGKITAANLDAALVDATPEMRTKLLAKLEERQVTIVGELQPAKPSIFGGSGTRVEVADASKDLPVLSGDRTGSVAGNLDATEPESKTNLAFNKAAAGVEDYEVDQPVLKPAPGGPKTMDMMA